MASSPKERMTLDEVRMVGPVRRIWEMDEVGAALVEEGDEFLETILKGLE